jgi:hypothetical protein
MVRVNIEPAAAGATEGAAESAGAAGGAASVAAGLAAGVTEVLVSGEGLRLQPRSGARARPLAVKPALARKARRVVMVIHR